MQLRPSIPSEQALHAGHFWQHAPSTVELFPGEVHIWRPRFSMEEFKTADFWPLLSDDEKYRASRFHFPEDSGAYVLSHAMLRDVLLRYRAHIRRPLLIAKTPDGKLNVRQSPRVHFSLSHSRSLALVGLTLDCELGVDVEPISVPPEWRSLATSFFSDTDQHTLFALPEPDQGRAFLTLWTRREAYLKARGEGLSTPLNAISLCESTDGTFHLTDSRDPHLVSNWFVHTFNPDDQHLGALAVTRDLVKVLFWNWRPLSAPTHSALGVNRAV